MDEMGILKRYDDIAIHDFLPAYAKYSCQHAYCNAHICRELQGIYDGFEQEWAKERKVLLEEAYKCVFVVESMNDTQIQEFMERYDVP